MKKIKFEEMRTLKGKIREAGMTYRSISPCISMTPATLSNKLNGYSLFNINEIQRMAGVLNIDPTEYGKIFFAPGVRNVTEKHRIE